jgi:2-dehydropantoate 2-reductase
VSRSYAVIGTGAIGGYYGARLNKAGFLVHFLLRSDYQIACEKGLTIQSIDGDFVLPQIAAYNDPAKMPRCDVIMVALKTTKNHLLPQILPQVMHEDTVVVLLQNGLGTEADVAQIPGVRHILGGLCFICCYKTRPALVEHTAYGRILLGEYAAGYRPCGCTETVKMISRDFQTAGLTLNISADLMQSRWQKLVWNIPYNSLSVILDATTTEIMNNPASRHLVEAIMQEVALGAAASGRKIADSFIQEMLAQTDRLETPYLTSMKLDYNARRPLEIEAILKNPLMIARTAGVTLPKIEMLYQQLAFLSDRNAKIEP